MISNNKVDGQIGNHNEKRIFQLSDVNALLPLLHRITEEAHQKVKRMIHRIGALQNTNQELSSEIESEINKEFSKWQSKVVRLGAAPKGMWLADFDHGSGYYCWKYPETQIQYAHGYQDGFSARVEIPGFRNQNEHDIVL